MYILDSMNSGTDFHIDMALVLARKIETVRNNISDRKKLVET